MESNTHYLFSFNEFSFFELILFGSISHQDVGHAENVGTDDDHGDSHVGENAGHEVEYQVVDDRSSVGVSVTIIARSLILRLVRIVVKESQKFVSRFTEGQSGDPGTDSNYTSQSKVLVSLHNGDNVSSCFHA